MLIGGNLVLGSFAIIAAATFPAITATTVAGRNTPVWTAHCPHPAGCDQMRLGQMGNFVKYQLLEAGAVGRAIDYMKSDGFRSLRGNRPSRSIKEYVEDADVALVPASGHNGTRSKRSYSAVYRTSKVLAVTQYDPSGVTDDASRERFINENILYAIAYWRLFNAQAERDRTGKRKLYKVRVELVGIIVCLDRAATPYLSTSYEAQPMLAMSNNYWSSLNAEFPRSAYHAIATITDIVPYNGLFYGSKFGFYETSYIGVGGGSGTIIAWDYNVFTSVRGYSSAWRPAGSALYFLSDRQLQIPDYMKPGQPVEVLPGQLYSPEQQCWLAGYKDLDRLCPEYSENCSIYCLNKGILRFCGSIGWGFEGTPCVNGKVG